MTKNCAGQVEADKEAVATKALAVTLYDTALLESGFDLENPQDFNKRIHRILASSLGLQEGSLDASGVSMQLLSQSHVFDEWLLEHLRISGA